MILENLHGPSATFKQETPRMMQNLNFQLKALRFGALCALFASLAILTPGCATCNNDGPSATYAPHGGPCCADMEKACSSEQKACASEKACCTEQKACSSEKACTSAEAKCEKPCGDDKCCKV